jgi:hypothetical protein
MKLELNESGLITTPGDKGLTLMWWAAPICGACSQQSPDQAMKFAESTIVVTPKQWPGTGSFAILMTTASKEQIYHA